MRYAQVEKGQRLHLVFEAGEETPNGEIVTDWDRYLHPHDGDKGDEAVAECPACYGRGYICDDRCLQQHSN